MAHQLKYYKEIDSHGHLWRVEFLQDTDNAISRPVEIGPVLQSLRLVLQGDQANVDTPIVKTSLEMSFIDAPDMDAERKCGYWEEFYTSSATEFMVCLYKDGEKEWSGYVTPDSFAEDLRYRGSVSIIARDNIGTLQDITFDTTGVSIIDGKARIQSLIYRAISKSNCALDFTLDETLLPYSSAEDGRYEIGGNAAWQYIDAQGLADLSWQDVLDNVLYSIGAVLRYVGKNRLVVVPLRDIPKCGRADWWDVPIREARFLSYGRRELIPGVKSITETHEFEIDKPGEKRPTIADYISEGGVQQRSIYLMHKDYTSGSGGIELIPAWSYRNPTTGLVVDTSNTALLNVSAYERVKGEDSEEYGTWDDSGILYFAVNVTENNQLTSVVEKIAEFSYPVFTSRGKVNISFTVDKPVSLTPDGRVMNTPVASASSWGMNPGVRWYLKLVRDGVASYYDSNNKSWSSEKQWIPIRSLNTSLFNSDKVTPTIIELQGVEVPGPGVLSIEIASIYIETLEIYTRLPSVGMWMRIRDISVSIGLPDDFKSTMLSRVTITTENSDKYAVRLTRSPEYAVNETTLPEVALLPNAILFARVFGFFGVGDWSWHGKGTKGEGISLARLIQQQLLAYHGKPNNLLTGELYGDDLALDGIWVWNDTPHMLISGTHNILTGRIEGATLREYKRYDHIWETWVENEDVVVDYTPSFVSFRVHSNDEMDQGSWGSVPSWVTPVGHVEISANEYLFDCEVQENASGAERTAVFTIGTAKVRITQRAAGDYGTDYGMDYA